ncbi:MAG: hypothetical protein ABIK92_04210 [Pseudomonadota bacterium]
MEDNRKISIPNLFQVDLIKNRYHIFDLSKAKAKNYYPKQLLKLIPKLSSFNRNFEIVVGNIYSTRAFFAISEPIDNEVEYESGYLDLKIIMKENNVFIGEVVTSLPPVFILQKGLKIKFKKDNILYKPDYNSIKKADRVGS